MKAAIDEIARRDNDVGLGVERVYVRNGAFQIGRRIDAPVKKLTLLLEMRVRNLRNQHFTAP